MPWNNCFTRCFRVESSLPFAPLVESSDDGVLHELRTENSQLREHKKELESKLAASEAKLELELERNSLSPRRSSMASAMPTEPAPTCSPVRNRSPLASPAAARVRRCVLANMLDRGRHSALVIYTFDVWRMLMYVRMQHDLGKEENVQQQLQHERALQECKAKLRFDREESARHEEDEGLVITDPACEDMTLSALLDAGERELNSAYRRVQELELDCNKLRRKNSELERHLQQVQASNVALDRLVDASQELWQEEVAQAQVAIESTPARLSRRFRELDQHRAGQALNDGETIPSPGGSKYSFAQLREAQSRAQKMQHPSEKENMPNSPACQSGAVIAPVSVAVPSKGTPAAKGRAQVLSPSKSRLIRSGKQTQQAR